jgi:hypothetical protein
MMLERYLDGRKQKKISGYSEQGSVKKTKVDGAHSYDNDMLM